MTKTEKNWYKHRTYLHFDQPLTKIQAEKLVKNKDNVTQHSFFPLISYFIETDKIYKDDDGVIKKKTKKRPISYASHKDSHIYAYYSRILLEKYEDFLEEKGISDCVLAFRSLKKSNIEFAKEAFDEIRNKQNCIVLALDISKFFENLDHKIIKKHWKTIIKEKHLPDNHYAVFKAITKYSEVNREELYKLFGISIHNPKYPKRRRVCTAKEFRKQVCGNGLIKKHSHNKGIPQGTPISATLSNIYMIDFDIGINKFVSEKGGRYFRYCDDMLIVIDKKFESDLENFINVNIELLEGIEINSEKTEKRIFNVNSNGILFSDKPLQYLGFIFDGQRILIRSSSLARFSKKMKKAVNLAKRTMEKRNHIREDKGLTLEGLYRKSLYRRYSYLGNRNFLSYGYRASRIMESEDIRKQLKPLWNRLQNEINKNED